MIERVSEGRLARHARLATAAVVAAALCLVVTASTASAAPQGPWVLPAGNLSSPGQNASGPQISTAPNGSATAIWNRFNGSNGIIQTSASLPGGSFGAPADLSVPGQGAAGSQITTAPDGSATAVWYRFNGSNTIIQAATRPPGGSFAAPVDLSAPGQDAFVPQITTAPDGTAIAVWQRFNGSNTIIQAATRPPGGSFEAPEDLSATGQNAFSPEITTAPDGTTTAVWTRSNGSDGIIQAATRPPGGSFGPPVDLSATGENAAGSQIATAPDGTTTAVWSRYNGSNRIIQAATRPAGGSFAAPVDLSATGENAVSPEISTAPDGTTTAVWNRSDGSNIVIQTATRPPGSSFGAPTDLSAPGQDADSPQIFAAPDGSVTAVWERSNGSHNIIQSAATAQPSVLLRVKRKGSGSGAVASVPGGISCGTDCAESFLSFTPVALTASPSKGSTFTGWSGGGCSGKGVCEVTMLDATEVTAGFGKPRFAQLKITPKSKKLKSGRKITFKVKLKNTGDATASKLKICTKGSKKLVKAPKCKKPGNLAAGKSKSVKLRVSVKKRAKKGKKAKITFTATARGGLKKSGKATIRVK